MSDTRSATATGIAQPVARSRRRSGRAAPMKGGARFVHLFGALAMIVGLFLPLMEADRALAAPNAPSLSTTLQGQDVNTTAFTQVAAIGDFQGQFGCGGFDINCQATQLTNHNGIWTGVFAVPPGQWQWQIAAMTQDGQQLVLSESGRDTSATLSLSEGDAGAYFEFDSARQETSAAAVPSIAQLSTDTGTYALAPDGGNFSAILEPSPAGQINAELQIDGAPVGNPQVIQVGQGPTDVTVDPTGNVIDSRDLGYATLTVNRIDGATGESLPGGCYEVLQGGTAIGRGCDTDDGMADGSIRIAFPGGAQPGAYTVAETSAPDGAEQAPDQDVDLQATDNSIDITTGEAVEEPTEETGGIEPIPGEAETPEETEIVEAPEETEVVETPEETVVDEAPGELYVTLQDANGQPIGGACFQLIQDGEVVQESCDISDAFPFNGTSGFTGVPAGTYTLHQSGVPEGTEAAPDQDVTIPSGDEENVTVQAAAPAEPTPEPEGDIVALRQDDAGTPVGGACFEVIDASGSVVASACDEEGDLADDGRTGLFDIPEGTYTLRESRTPEGYEPAADQQVQVAGNQSTDVPVRSAQVLVEEPTEVPAEEPTEVPTEDPTEVPIEEPTEAPTEDPTDVPIEEPTEVSPEEPTEVPTEEATEVPTEEPTGEAVPGSLIVTLQDEAGQPIGGACFQLVRDGEVVQESCDSNDDFPDNGNTGFFGVESGTYTLRQSTAAEGTQPISDQEVTVPADDLNTVVVQAPAPEATDVPTEEPTEVPTEEPTDVPTEDATEAPVDVGGQVVVDLAGVDVAPGDVCVELNTSGGIGMIDPPAGCNEAAAGQIVLDEVPQGNYSIFVTQGPEELVAEGPQAVSVTEGETSTVALQAPEQEQGVLPVVAVNTNDEPLPGACWTLTSDEDGTALGPLCDDGANDGIPDDGQVQFEDITPGPWTLAQTQAPDGYAQVEPVQVDIVEGENPQQRIQHQAVTSSIQVTTVDEAGAPLAGACYSLNHGDPVCDGEDANGITVFNDVAPDDYTLSMTTPPEGYQPAADEQVSVSADAPALVTITVSEATGSIQVTTLDEAGQPLDGACYSVDGGDPVCDGEGVVTIEDVSVGERNVSLTTIPDGYQGAADQVVNVSTEAPAPLTFQLSQATGSIVVTIVDEAGAPVPSVCYSLNGGEQRCDNEVPDGDPADGTILIEGVSLGEHTVVLESVPEGLELPADGETVDVTEDEPAQVRFELAPTPPSTGGLDVRVQMDTEELVPGVCVVLTNSADNTELGPFCDEGEGDTNADAGVIGIEDVDVGIYNVSLAPDTVIDGGDVANATSPSVEVSADAQATGIITVPTLPDTGTVRIVTTDGSVNLPDACYDLALDGTTIAVCDNDGTNDNDGTDGVIEVMGLDPGTWSLTMTTAPAGYETAAPTEVTVTAGETSTVEVTVTAIPEPGSLTVIKVDEAGEQLGGSCFALRQGGTTIQGICDAEDGTPNDGVMVFSDLEAGAYELVETRTPGRQYQPADPQTVTIAAGEDHEIEVTNVERPGRLSVITVQDDDRTERLQNACYRLDGEQVFGPFCDADDGTVDGRVSFVNVPAGDYTLVQTVAPAGYDVAESRNVTITAGASLQITVANAQTPPPAETGTLVVIPLDENGAEVSGGCYHVLSGETPVTGRLCDNDDDVDKRIIFGDLPVGTYTLRELLAPSPAFQIAPDQDVEIRLNETTEVQVPHELKDGRLLVQVVNSLGQPLSGACFDLADDGQGPACSGNAGEVLFSDLAPGTYRMTQTEAPSGYRLIEEPREAAVYPGQTSVVRVVLQTAPPPNSGSLQVQKFVCPAGEDGERTQFLGGAQGNAELARTAGCVPGTATFTLQAEDGSGSGPGEFTTNAEGRYQTTLTQGLYVLTETDPDLPGNSSARLRIGVGQMTTVIVINYVAPPEPEPATVNVASFTCPPSFNGTSYGDFAASCTSDSARANNLTVRLEGETDYKRITGDQGRVGTTTFTDIPAGSYEIYGEKPFTVPVMYLFCGTDANAPAELKAINGSVPLNLQHGQTVTCHFFQVPEQFSSTTGAILVHKFDCPVDQAAKGYDWQNECSRSETQVMFSLDIFNQEMQEFEPLTEVRANPDGLVRFPDMRPGTYKLEEVDAKWCFAQSNSVNADGNVVVQAGKLSEVWVYNCVGTQQPPNTGSGDAAGLLSPVDDGASGTMVLMNLAWPAIALVAWFGWRSRATQAVPMVVRRQDDMAA